MNWSARATSIETGSPEHLRQSSPAVGTGRANDGGIRSGPSVDLQPPVKSMLHPCRTMLF